MSGQYYWAGKPVAFYLSGGAAQFQHQNWTDTERLRTTYTGGVEGSFTTLPFGDDLTVTGTDSDASHFAMLDYDAPSESYHAQFRQYSDKEGRWMRPDPYCGSYDVTNPQSMNRYTYALNNPLSAVDPSGLYIVTDCGDCWGAGNPNYGSSGGDGEFTVYDTVSTDAGTYSYNNNVWQQTMQDGLGGGVIENDDGSLWSSAGTGNQFLGNTWQDLVLVMGSIQPSSMASGAVTVARNNGKMAICSHNGCTYIDPSKTPPDGALLKWYLCGNGVPENIKNYTLEGISKGALVGGIAGSEGGLRELV